MGDAARRTALVLLALSAISGVATALTWTETSRQDFSDGQFSSSNVYASFRYGGTVEFVPRFDFNNDGWMDLVCSEGYGSNVYLYFGDTSGFSPSRSRDYPVPGGGECDGADLNCDGFTDLIHTGWRAEADATIYWGTNSGPDPQNTTKLPVSNSEAVTVADLDNDGYLDIVLSSEDGTSYIYWGSSTGYSSSDVTLLSLGTDTGHNWVVADLNKDGYLDLVGCCTNNCTHQPIFYFGPNRTYHLETLDFSPGGSGFDAQGVTVADLDRNGWLDIVYTGHDDITQAWIYWGSDSGFSAQNRTVINTAQCFGGSAAYDFNKDGWLDLLFFRGSYYGAYFKPIIYYNTASSPYFSDAQSSTIGPLTLNSTGGQVADYNKDGNVDIFLNDFEGNDAHVLWGPDWNTVTDLPCYSGHHGVAREIGNIYDRTYLEDYVSSVFDAGSTTNWQAVSWDDSTPGGSSVGMAVRTGATATPDAAWSGWYTVAKGDTVPDSLNSRYIQYRAELKYQNPASLPMLFAVRIDYGPGLTHDVGPTAILVPAGTVDSGAQVTPEVVVRNFGTSSEVFPMTLLIGSGYTQTLVDTLAAGARDTIQFPVWTAGSVGTLGVVSFTSLTGDQNPANDTIRDTVRVRRVWNLDVGPVAILSPAGTPESGKVYMPSVVIRNFGRLAATFPVSMAIGGTYDQTISETLAGSAADTVSFPSWTAMPKGITPLTCFTALVGDQDPTNDTIRDTVTVVGPPTDDVGATAILSPTGNVHAGDTVIPKARIRNLGNTAERYFGVQFRIGTSYSRTVTVTQSLSAGSTLDLTFPSWVTASGDWAVSCSTMLMNDVNRANDKVSSSVRVYAQSLVIDPDQSDRLQVGQSKTYRFYALITGDTGGVVEVARPSAPAGWSLRLGDASGANDLTDTDGDGIPDLGYVVPGETSRFSLQVTAPAGLVGDTASLAQRTFLIPGHVGGDPLVADTAVLTLTLVPGFSVHNFPNPFSDHTAFVIGLPEDGKVSLTVYTRAGERVRRIQELKDMAAGVHVVSWDGANDNGRAVAPGTYEYVLDYEHASKTDRIHKRLVLTKE